MNNKKGYDEIYMDIIDTYSEIILGDENEKFKNVDFNEEYETHKNTDYYKNLKKIYDGVKLLSKEISTFLLEEQYAPYIKTLCIKKGEEKKVINLSEKFFYDYFSSFHPSNPNDYFRYRSDKLFFEKKWINNFKNSINNFKSQEYLASFFKVYPKKNETQTETDKQGIHLSELASKIRNTASRNNRHRVIDLSEYNKPYGTDNEGALGGNTRRKQKHKRHRKKTRKYNF